MGKLQNMEPYMQISASLAIARFGFGAMPGELEEKDGDLVIKMLNQAKSLPAYPNGMSSADAYTQYQVWKQLKKTAKVEESVLAADQKNPTKKVYGAEAAAWLSYAQSRNAGFGLRLIAFWSNHFTVSAQKQIVSNIAGAYVREAIHPNIAGKFSVLLQAVVKHPAMLVYLDNSNSIGPDSKAGTRDQKGLNENLAREIFELHTLGVDGGYTPADIKDFAKLLTGWSVVNALGEDDSGKFFFRKNRHQPGPIKILDQSWAQTDMAEGEAFLDYIATHPKTARFIATKLVRHFVADEPPEAAVVAVEKAFLTSGGELMACYEALLKSPESWQTEKPKLKSPLEFLISSLRALQPKLLEARIVQSLAVMGQPQWKAISPKGWPDESKEWLSSDGMKTRLDFARTLATKASKQALKNPVKLAEDILGDRLTDETKTALSRAADDVQALTMLLMSPEFQRR
jgi:uncharacterized protein (DUF1800 family)